MYITIVHCALTWNHFQINCQDRTEVSLTWAHFHCILNLSNCLIKLKQSRQFDGNQACAHCKEQHKFWIKNINSWTKVPCVVVEWIYTKVQLYYVKREECMNLHIGGRWISKHGRQYWKEGKMKLQPLLHLDSNWR